MNIIEQLRSYDNLYYNIGKSPVTDEYYDFLKEKAIEQYPDDPYFQEVGFPTKDKVKLPFVLGSLDKIRADTYNKWVNEHKGPYLISQKMDGVSILVIYEDGKVAKAYTRGDGEHGKDITHKARIFCPSIENDSIMILRGEAMLLGDVYKTLGFSTARNGVAGILNRDNNANSEYITPFFYELIKFADLATYSEYERLVLIESIGLKTPLWEMLDEFDLERVIAFNALPKNYDTDGVVIAVNEAEREDVKFPKNKVAFKIQGKTYTTTVTDIEWRVSRNGRIVPTVVFESVDIDGVNVSRATGFNAEFILANKLSNGAKIEIVRSNDVIPYITNVLSTNDTTFRMPCECPACFNRVITKGVDLYCTGGRFGCEAIALKSTEYLLRTLGAENITSKTLEKIGVYTIENAYELTDYDILENDGFGPKSANIIISEIQKTLRTTPEKLLQAFGIPGVGSEISRSLLKCFEDVESVLYASPDELTECEGVGPKIAKNICNESSYCIDVYKYLLKKGLKFVNESNNDSLNGKQFALTGKGPMSREDISRMIEQSGGVVKGISKSTNYLVTSDTSSESGKMEKARKYGTQIISYDDLLNMLEE